MGHSSRRVVQSLCRQAVLGWMATVGAETALARTPPPSLRLPLEQFDYQPLSASVLNAGVSATTLHYVDAQHMLLTFSRRRLMARLPDDPPTDFDRNVDAVLLELPTGKILARTSWRMHDTEQYLWALPEGNFLLRDRDRLVTIAPLRGLASGDAFQQHPFVVSSRSIAAVLLSPTGDLLTLETLDQVRTPKERAASPGTRAYAAAAAGTAGEGAAEEEATPRVQVDFFRLVSNAGTAELRPVHAGTVGAHGLILLPVDGTGLLTELDQGRSHWAFDFHHHDGRVDELSPFDSTCHPLPFMVSRSEFIAFGCHGGQDHRLIGGFNLRGEEMWEQSFLESFTRPELAAAPAAGRFALGRMVTGVPVDGTSPISQEQVTAENVSVYQTESGRVLLSMNLTPVLLAGQNFALSPNGQQLAVVNNGAIEIYPLPGITPKEQQAVHLAETLIPERSEAPIRLEAIRQKRTVVSASADTPGSSPVETSGSTAPGKVGGAEAAVIGKPASAAAAGAGAAAAVSSETAPAGGQPTATAPSESTGDAVGDASGDPGGRRKPPTLYAPGEKPGGAEPSATTAKPR